MERKLLHWDVIQEILLRLPVKSLIRFKCVCKSWHSLISDPHFAKSHYELSAAPSLKFLRIACSGFEALSIDVYAPLNVGRLIPPLLPPNPDKDVYICGFCRGFVLIERYPNFCIWNPSTGSHRELSCPEIWKEEHQFVTIRLAGFGYDPSTDDYLVAVLFDSAFDDEIYTVKRLMLFSLRTNIWKEIQGSHLPDLSVYQYQSFFFNDVVHWLACRDEPFHCVILAFDLEKKNFYEISLPHLDVNHSFSYSELGTMGECLCFCCHFGDDTKTQVWIMKEYKVQSSWTMLEIPTHLSVVCMAKGGELIALRFDDTELLKFNDKGQLLERCMFDFRCWNWVLEFGFGMYTDSLLSLPRDCDGNTPSTEIDQENRNV
ncbi:F-box/kelch-repeat protein At3g23880-like [Gastrolobium bilobum]|uniref:F-box/kelch-repeat protein At3g23880-like n=1 Tax=Gastrolobium bilobum TaxID=150636 RepID=UPI002AB31F2C|nr:F-box/kelch-repeat protein At3g23880-like [Gastrolobium bilobum]